jgi:hypothetical protein
LQNLLDHLPTLNEVFELLNWPQLHAVLGVIGAAISIVFTFAKIWEWWIGKQDDRDFKDRIVKSPQKAVPAIRAIRLAEAIREQLILTLCQQLDKQLGKRVETRSNFGEAGFYLYTSYSSVIPYEFCLAFDKARYNEVSVAVRKISPVGQERVKLDWKALNDAFNVRDAEWQGRYGPNKGWLWWHFTYLPVDRNWQGSDDPWVAIADKTLAKKIAAAFDLSKRALEGSLKVNGPWTQDMTSVEADAS